MGVIELRVQYSTVQYSTGRCQIEAAILETVIVSGFIAFREIH
jgi:hypothetical protein